MAGNTTKIKKIKIEKFRALSNIEIEFGDRITVICGKNGTAKSTILGIVAQTFNFSTDWTKNKKLPYKTLTDERYKSNPSDHFRLSKKHDATGAMNTNIFMYDGYTKADTEMQLRMYDYADRPDPRPVMRGNKTIPGKQTSWNPTHPVIYLSLKRLTPITAREDYAARNIEYLQKNMGKFLSLNNILLNKKGTTKATATTGSIKSAVAHGEHYDLDAVSAGEDNAGQLLLALMSFRKLKEEYSDYKGGILLIDEADAGLFPAAQIALIKILAKECKELDLQVIMTSHSPTMIEEIHGLSTKAEKDYKTIYLTDSHGKIERFENWSWQDIYADLLTRTVEITDEISLPQVNIYFEDKEACDLFNKIITQRPLRKVISQFKDINLGCGQYASLIMHKIPEFYSKSIIVLDGDAKNYEHLSSVILLPGDLPPDQLLFEYLYNLRDDDKFWKNKIRFNKPIFRKAGGPVIQALNLTADTCDLKDAIDNYVKNPSDGNKLRELFKNFYKDIDVQKIVNAKASENILRKWVSENKESCEEFTNNFTKKLVKTLTKGHGIESGKLSSIAPTE